MNYQKIVCWGDSQTFGARTYGCYPLYLVQILNTETQYRWRAINISTNGHTARDLWFSIAHHIGALVDCYQACVLIGINDIANRSPIDLFEEYYKQSIDAFQIYDLKVVYCAQIPSLWPDGHPFFSSDLCELHSEYNECIERVVSESAIGRLVPMPDLSKDCFSDPVHFNEKGNRRVAEYFAQAIINY